MKYYSATDVIALLNTHPTGTWDQAALDAWATSASVTPLDGAINDNPDQELRKDLITLFKDKTSTASILDFASTAFNYIKDGSGTTLP